MVDLFSDPGSIPGASIKRSGPAKGGAVSFELSAISYQPSAGGCSGYTLQRREHASDFGNRGLDCIARLACEILQVVREGYVIRQFASGAKRSPRVPSKLRIAVLPASLRDVRGDRDRCTTRLRDQPKQLMLGPPRGLVIHRDRDCVRLVPLAVRVEPQIT
jgi:hypothetical protein